MGYTTTFVGHIGINTALSDEQVKLLNMQFANLELKRLCYCPWVIEKDHKGEHILVCENGKSRDYIEWLKILIEKLSPIYVFNGKVLWRGEDYTDNGKIVVQNNIITVYKSKYVI